MTPEQIQWLRDHFADTKNDDIAVYLGISISTMQRYKRMLGLHKSAKFMQLAQRHAVECSIKATKGMPPHPNSLAALVKHRHTFKKGETNLTRLGPEKERERCRKCSVTRRETIRKERMRIKWGLPQRTKLRLNEVNHARSSLRYILRKRGYQVKRATNVAYYDDNTQRGRRLEAWANKLKIEIKPKQD